MKTKVFKNNEDYLYTNKKTEIKALLKRGEEVFYVGEYIEKKVNKGKGCRGSVRWEIQRFHEKCEPLLMNERRLENIFN